ncbi:MAG: endonuclease MutS2 [bacterium]|nr:endonuclease MutS2 [bacterium]
MGDNSIRSAQTYRKQMMKGNDFSTSLELEKVLSSIAQYAASELVKQRILKLRPRTVLTFLEDDFQKLECLWYLLEEGTPPFSELGNPTHLLTQLQSLDAKLSPEDFLELLRMLICFRKVYRWFNDRAERAAEVMNLVHHIRPQPQIEEWIQNIIDPNGNVYDDASSELKRLRRELQQMESKLQDVMQRYLRQWSQSGYVPEPIIALRNGHFTIPILSQYRNKVAGVIQDVSNSGNTVYIEPYEAIEVTNRQITLKNAEIEEVLRILRELANAIHPLVSVLSVSLETVVLLADYCARVEYGKAMKGSLPILSTQQVLRLKNARHPLLQQRLGRNATVPLDMELTEDIGKILLISGPNAGGKTVALKTIGLAVAMTKLGLPVIADYAEIPFVDEIYAIIGDEQSLEQDLSTFSAHLYALEKTFHTRTSSKLILVDEICSGTDPTEGAALAKAMMLRWLEDKCFVVTTTHQSALKLFAYETQGIVNGSMEFDKTQLKPTFRFRMNVPGSSYALEIAKQVKIPSAIRERASEFLGERTLQIEHLLESITQKKEQIEQHLRDIENQRAQAEQYRQQAESLRHQAQTLFEQSKRQAAKMTEEFLADASKRIEREIQQLREKQASKESIREAHQAIHTLRAELRSIIDKPIKKASKTIAISHSQNSLENNEASEDASQWKMGSQVMFRDSDTVGEIVGLADDYVQVSVGNVTMRVSYDQLILLSNQKKSTQPQPRTQHRLIGSTTQSFQLDIRGLNREEAIEEIERFLADAVADGWSTVEIIHGKGMGVLREATAEVLKRSPLVKEWRLGLIGEGSGGATIVVLK